jgi:hypothetical protein
MDTDWKLVIFVHNILAQRQGEREHVVFLIAQEVMGCSLAGNRSVEMLGFCFKYICFLFGQAQAKEGLAAVQAVLRAGLGNLVKFDPVKKVPVYDQHLLKPTTDAALIRVN